MLRVFALLAASIASVIGQTPLYSCNGSLNSVTVSNPVTGTSIGTVAVPGHPLDIALSPDGLRAYTANFRGSSISVIDTATRTLLQTLNVGSYPSGIGVSPDGTKLYVVRDFGGEVQIRDAQTLALLRTVPTPATNGGFGSVTFTPDGRRAYITGWAITVLDTATDQVVAAFSAGFCASLAITPDGSRVYCSDGWQGAVYGFDTLTHTLQSTTPVAGLPGSIDILRDGSKAVVAVPAYLAGIQGNFAALPQRVVQVIDLQSHAVSATVITREPPGTVVRTVDGTRVCITMPNAGQVLVLDPANLSTLIEYPAGPRPSAAAMGPATATTSAYGTGCALPTGPLQLSATTAPWLGERHTVAVAGLPVGAMAIRVIGLDAAMVPLDGLAPGGAFGCHLLLQPLFIENLVPTGGTLSLNLDLPDDASLIGITLLQQVLTFQAPNLGVSNGLRSTLGMR